MDTIIVRVIDMPIGVNGATVRDEEGDYNIYINARISSDKQQLAFRHEICHIRQEHFYSGRLVAEMEKEI